MNFINPSVEYWPQEAGMEGIWKQIARTTRVCYQSVPRNNETDEEFVKKVILKPALIEGDLNNLEQCKFDNNRLHGEVLEHGTVYLYFPSKYIEHPWIHKIISSSYNRTAYDADGNILITSNMRYLIEYGMFYMFKEFGCKVPSILHPKRYTFSVITDIGVTREMNRHRTFSVCEESTRYCDFSKDKFGGELTFITPSWMKLPSDKLSDTEILSLTILHKIEEVYKQLRKLGWKPEQAREVLPLGLKTQAVYTAFIDDWKHFLTLRADNVSGKAHPNIQVIANEIKKIAEEQKLW